MTKLELTALFTALDRLLENNDIEGARKVLSVAITAAKEELPRTE